MLLIGHIVGSFQLDAVLACGDTIRASPLYAPALLLVLAGAFTKSAQFSISLLAAAGDGSADAGIGVLALGDDGKGRVFYLHGCIPRLAIQTCGSGPSPRSG